MRIFQLPGALVLAIYLSLSWSAAAAFDSGIYETVPNTTAEERGERVLNGFRVVPFSATLTFDLNATQPALTAFIPNAVVEGGEPFALTVHSTTGQRLTDGSYRFRGDYLGELYPSGSQYGFDWNFSAGNAGTVLWNGSMAWYGGHVWQVTITDVAIVPEPGGMGLLVFGLSLLPILRVRRGLRKYPT